MAMNMGNKQSGTSAATGQAGAESKLNTILIYAHFVAAIIVFAVGAFMWTSERYENSDSILAFLLIALSLLLTSFSALKLRSELQKQVLIVVSIVVAGLGAYFHVVGLMH